MDRERMTDPPHESAPMSTLVRQLEKSREEMHSFVRTLSHDLNANFMIIEHCFKGLSEAIAADGSPEIRERANHLDVCLRQTRQFVQDLVVLARTGSIEMDPEDVSISEVVSEVLEQQRDLLDERRINVCSVDASTRVRCNRKRVHQIITNLLRNAVKHGCDAKRPEISISAEPSSLNEGFIEIRVHDNGAGIPSAYREVIFEPGRRAPDVTSEGSGMGLAIVDKIARYYDGRACVEPSNIGGTTILVMLPAVAEKASTSPDAAHLRPRFDRDASHRAPGRPPHGRKAAKQGPRTKPEKRVH